MGPLIIGICLVVIAIVGGPVVSWLDRKESETNDKK
jgi:hypothetical protein